MRLERYPSLNGLRAISIILVILHHLSIQNDIFKNLSEVNSLQPLIYFLQDGHLGVNVFFVISGFLITSLLLQEEISTGTISLKNFYIRRSLRIFPAYFFLLFVYFLLQISGYIKITNSSWFTAITYTKYFNWDLDWQTAHFWSLSVEEHFYIFWPFVFIAGKKIRKNVVVVLILIVPLIRWCLNFYPIGHMGELTIFRRIDAIAVGCFVALYKEEILKRISLHWTKIFYFSVVALFFLRYFQIFADKIYLGFIVVPLGLTHGTIANILIALIMLYSVFGPHKIWYKVLNLKIVNYIGVLSYSIYLWQQLFIYRTTNFENGFPQNLLFILLAAMCSYYIIERPFLKLKSKFSVGTEDLGNASLRLCEERINNVK
jgi:peptidoglycan/LPS O-acetylase OafA/YrhL